MPVRSILVVCLGNICRSPLAEAVLRAVALERRLDVEIASAGTGGYHLGSPADRRAAEVARREGVDLSANRSRQVAADDFARFDLILAMDRSNLEDLRNVAPDAAQDRIHLFLSYAGIQPDEVPDPFFGGPEGFDAVYRTVREASERIADRLEAEGSDASSGQASSTT